MKKIFFALFIGFFVIMAFLHFTSCKPVQTNAPVIVFDTIVGYVYEDTTLPPHTIFPIMVSATKNGVNDLVESGKITKSVNGGPDSILQTMTFVTTQFLYTYNYYSGNTPGEKDKYIFTFGNQNGASASDSVIITVN